MIVVDAFRFTHQPQQVKIEFSVRFTIDGSTIEVLEGDPAYLPTLDDIVTPEKTVVFEETPEEWGRALVYLHSDTVEYRIESPSADGTPYPRTPTHLLRPLPAPPLTQEQIDWWHSLPRTELSCAPLPIDE
jgi:hypothetical protein